MARPADRPRSKSTEVTGPHPHPGPAHRDGGICFVLGSWWTESDLSLLSVGARRGSDLRRGRGAPGPLPSELSDDLLPLAGQVQAIPPDQCGGRDGDRGDGETPPEPGLRG